jgi:hypothetical protein
MPTAPKGRKRPADVSANESVMAVNDDDLLEALRGLYDLIVQLKVDLAATQMILKTKAGLRESELDRYKEMLTKELGPEIESAQKANARELLELLRRHTAPKR